VIHLPDSQAMDTPLAADCGKLSVAEMMHINSKEAAAHDMLPMLFGKILKVINAHSLTSGYPMVAKFAIAGFQDFGSVYDLRTHYPKFGIDKIETDHMIERIRNLLEDPASCGFTTYIDEIDVTTRVSQSTLIIDWSVPKKH
jgi:hypothetical protein